MFFFHLFSTEIRNNILGRSGKAVKNQLIIQRRVSLIISEDKTIQPQSDNKGYKKGLKLNHGGMELIYVDRWYNTSLCKKKKKEKKEFENFQLFYSHTVAKTSKVQPC